MDKRNIKIKALFLSAEVAPLAKIGGLGDVAGALPQNLLKLGVDIRICLPFYGSIDQKKYSAKKIIANLAVPIDGKKETVDVYQANLPGSKVLVYLIKHLFFDSKEIYIGKPLMLGGKYTKPLDELKRFAFFTRAALEAAKKLNFRPDVIHANDWHVALAADFIKTLNRQNNFFAKTKTLYTIHNLANQGITKPDIIGYTKIDPELPVIKVDAKDGDINFMVQGILGSDLINTVSPTYAKEILEHYQGAGLEKILAKRKKDLYGIINGIDTDFFNPATDNLIKQKYSLDNLDKKVINKLDLQKQLGLPVNKNMASIGLVSRLVWQKGLDLITENFSRLNCQFVFLGTGQKEHEQQLLNLSKKFPEKFSAQIKFDEKLAHKIYAGADIFLMPSRFEPCGLGQMIAMRYGTVPLVRATGGLADTVNNQTGFSFKKYSSQELYKTINKALRVYYKNKKLWQSLQLNGMKTDFSWDKSAKEYVKLYKKIKK